MFGAFILFRRNSMTNARIILALLIAGTAVAQEKPASEERLPAGAVRRLGTSAYRVDGKVADLSRDGKWLALKSERDRALILMDAENGRIARRIPESEFGESGLGSMRFTVDSMYLRTLYGHTIQTWQRDPWQLVDQIDLPGDTKDPSPSHLASADVWIGHIGGEVHDPYEAFDVHSGKRLFRFQQSYCLAPSKELAAYWKMGPKDKGDAGETGSVVEVVNLKTGRMVGHIHSDIAEVYGLSLSNDGKQLAVTGYWGLEVWDVADGKLKRAWPGYSETLTAFTPDGRTLVAAKDEVVRSWDIATGKRNPPMWNNRPRGDGDFGLVVPSKDNRVLGIRTQRRNR